MGEGVKRKKIEEERRRCVGGVSDRECGWRRR